MYSLINSLILLQERASVLKTTSLNEGRLEEGLIALKNHAIFDLAVLV